MEVKKFTAKIILVPIKRKDVFEYVGKTIYRLSGPVTIHRISHLIEFTFNNHPSIPLQKFNGEGFYIPIAYVTNPIYDDDERCVPLKVSEYGMYEKYIARLSNSEEDYKLLPGLVPGGKVTKILITHGLGHKSNPFNPNFPNTRKADDDDESYFV